MRAERATLSRHNDVDEAIDYMLIRWLALARFLVDGRIRLSNNAAEPALREIATIAVAGCSPGPAVVMSEPP